LGGQREASIACGAAGVAAARAGRIVSRIWEGPEATGLGEVFKAGGICSEL